MFDYIRTRFKVRLSVVLAFVILPCAVAPAQDARQEGEVVLQEVPLALEAPGSYRYVSAYYDGARFYVDIARLFKLLGFDTRLVPPVLEALDASRTYRIDFAEGTARSAADPAATVSLEGEFIAGAGRYYVTMEGLSRLFGADVYFEEERLSLRLSTAAEGFDAGALRRETRLPGQAPGPLRFGRERRLLGGLMASYQLSRRQTSGQTGRYRGNLTFTGSVLGGALRGSLQMMRLAGARRGSRVSVPSLSYLFDRPGSRWLTRIEVGRFEPSSAGAPEPLEGIRLSNLPLSSRFVQRTSKFSGQAAPHALVEALVSGVVVDRVEADQAGRYRLSVPTYYGSTEATVRTTPLGGAEVREERRYLFATSQLAEPGRLYWDAYLGRARYSRRKAGLLGARYGLLPPLTARAAGLYAGGAARARLGAAFSPTSFSVVSADVDVPSGRLQAGVKLWQSQLSLEADYERAPRPSVFSVGRQRFASQLTATWGRLSGSVTATFAEGFTGWSHLRISPSVSFFGKGGLTAELSLSAQRIDTGRGARLRTGTYRAALGGTFFLPGGSSRLALFARGSERRAVRESGAEGFVSWRRATLGFSAGYDFARHGFAGALTLRLDAPLGGFSSRGTVAGRAFSHEETLYGSLELGRRVRLSRGMLEGSSAVIRVFEDLDGDGRYSLGEPLRPEVQVQLYQAGLERQSGGALRAGFLQPYGRYQVEVIERSIRDPLLVPATGYTFSFIADPGRTRHIDVPLQRLPVVTGFVRGLAVSPARLRLLVFEGGEQVEAADLYLDGGFTLQLPPGRYRLRLVDVVTGRTFTAEAEEVVVEAASADPIVLELRAEEAAGSR